VASPSGCSNWTGVAWKVLLCFCCHLAAAASRDPEVPQFVSVTFDDNFGVAAPDAVWSPSVIKYFEDRQTVISMEEPSVV
jgi:hypothetical protein